MKLHSAPPVNFYSLKAKGTFGSYLTYSLPTNAVSKSRPPGILSEYVDLSLGFLADGIKLEFSIRMHVFLSCF